MHYLQLQGLGIPLAFLLSPADIAALSFARKSSCRLTPCLDFSLFSLVFYHFVYPVLLALTLTFLY